MKEIKKTSDALSSEVQRKNVLPPKGFRHMYYITALLAITTVIAGTHITDIWSGIISMMCAVATIWSMNISVGGLDDDGI